MKSFAVVLVLIMRVLAGVAVPVRVKGDSTVGGWQITQIDPDAGKLSSIAIDSIGNPHIAYFNKYNGPMYTSFDGVSWSIEPINVPGGVISLALDKSDVPHVTFTKPIPLNMSYQSGYANKTGGIWKNTIIDKSEASYGGSIAIATNGTVHIIYNTGIYGIRYVQIVNGSYIKSTVDGNQYSEIDTDRAIAIDSKGIPHVGYKNWNPSLPVNTIHYTNLDNGSWNLSTIERGGVMSQLLLKMTRLILLIVDMVV